MKLILELCSPIASVSTENLALCEDVSVSMMQQPGKNNLIFNVAFI